MNCANYSALLNRQKLIWSHLLSFLPLYCVLLGSFCHHRHHHFRHIARCSRCSASLFCSVMSCFCLYCYYIIYCMLPLEVTKVVQMADFAAGAVVELCENMTSSTKPKVYNILHYRPRRIEPWSQITCTEKFVKFGRVVFEICECTNKQTKRQTDIRTHCSQYFAPLRGTK